MGVFKTLLGPLGRNRWPLTIELAHIEPLGYRSR
jgi:hypothetical protein